MLEGEWQILSVEYGGEVMPGRTGVLQVIGKRFAIQIGGTPREVGSVEWAVRGLAIDLDLVWRDSAGGETRRLRAIARTRGQLMQFCYYPETTPDRPDRFESRASESRPPAILVRCRRGGVD